MYRVTVINPNSSPEVTEVIQKSIGNKFDHILDIKCLTLNDGPKGIESQRDADSVIAPLLELISDCEAYTDVFILACYSDPGIFSAREVTNKPVLGIAQSALSYASNLGQRVGVISITDSSVERHTRYARAIQYDPFIVADISANLSIRELSDPDVALSKLLRVARTLKQDYATDIIVLGCAGMGSYRHSIEKELNIAVIDPIQASIGLALSTAAYRYSASV
ncbi:aspartate/glutamate racemase family protein [Photobacterium satsumensis]|uniref:aspartate/glutamate racemase family protein n=1 Tax=Photobacterium satsumensis TaxID=2910239 RepID=UPI003D1365EB